VEDTEVAASNLLHERHGYVGRATYRCLGMQDWQKAPPVFVVGFPRSGTTLLRVMLDAHPDLSIPPESHFIPSLWSVRRRYRQNGSFDADRMVRDVMSSTRVQAWELSEESVRARLRTLTRPDFASVTEAIFSAYAESKGKARWGDKTPGYSIELPLLARLFPDARFVHIIRDGRDVALSFKEGIGWNTPIEAIAEVWSRRIQKAHRDGARLGTHRYMDVRYEDLVVDPEGVLRTVCDLLDLDFLPEMLAYSGKALATVPAGERSIHPNLARPPTKGLRDWRRQMAPDQVRIFEAIAGTRLSDLGYERAYAQVPLGMRVRVVRALAANWVKRAKWTARRRLLVTLKPNAMPLPRRW
jgi:hypothetical protein